jgi:hypothetical protein
METKYISTEDAAKNALGLYYYSYQKEMLHEFAAENQARLMRYMESHDISFNDDKNIVVILHSTLFRLVQDVLTVKYNTQANIDETRAFLSHVKMLLDSAGASLEQTENSPPRKPNTKISTSR